MGDMALQLVFKDQCKEGLIRTMCKEALVQTVWIDLGMDVMLLMQDKDETARSRIFRTSHFIFFCIPL